MFQYRLLAKINLCQRLRFSTTATIPSEYIKTIKFRTCINVYDELRLRYRQFYRRSPIQGVDITINYVDTQPNQKPKKTIVALHGLADSFRTFNLLFHHFQFRSDVRLVMPNFPDFSQTRATKFKFWHSSDEKYHLLQDLFRNLNVDTIDCLVTHSFGGQPASVLLEKPKGLQIKSLALIAPQFFLDGLEERLHKNSKKTLRLSKTRFFSRLLDWKKAHQATGIPLKFQEMDEFFLLSTVFLDIQAVKDSHSRIQSMREMKLSGFIMYSFDENVISKKAQQELYRLLNIENVQPIIIDQDDPKIIDNNYLLNNPMTKIMTKDGRHLPHQKYPNVINFLIEKLIDK
uniref:Uncharacterized protein LOC113792767 n=1 Tax=Dermatophagoides pteronyssinus TaxID=6956 RepID=A0A6P6XZ70_DERPT|nr:uncharacterized protein LOC113792767 [Dermatophagoides pteronyssinus]